LVVYFDDGFADIIYVSGNNLEFSRAVNFKSGGVDNLLKEIKHTVAVLNLKNKVIEPEIKASVDAAKGGAALALMTSAPFPVKCYLLSAGFCGSQFLA
jgi:hypothetical protein